MVETKHTLMIVVNRDDADYFKTIQSIFKKQGMSASFVFKQFVNAYKKEKGDEQMTDPIKKFISESLNAGVDYMFNRGTTPIMNIVRTQHFLCNNKLLELRIIIYRDVTGANKIVDDSKPEMWYSIFDDLLKQFLKAKTDERSIKSEFFFHCYSMPIEFQITEDSIIFLDNKVVEKNNNRLEKIIQFIQENPSGRTMTDISLFIKNYKPEDRKEIQSFLKDSEDVVRTEKEGGKKGIIVYSIKGDA